MSAPDAANRAAAARDAARDAHRAMRAAPPDAASRVADALRAKEPLLDMKQRTTHDDPEGFMPTFFAASRLHYIGTWRRRYEAFLEEVLPPPPLPPPPAGRSERLVLHVDMDCFFAAVASLGRPELQGLPVAVSWSSAGDGELSSCNYPARALGCRAGMRISSAKRLCPDLVVMPYEFERYTAVALDVYRALHDLTPHVVGVSVDEAYLDVTSDPRAPAEVARDVRAKIFAKTGCVASVGSGPNRLVARLATKRAKPDGAFHVAKRDAEAFVRASPLRDLPGVGRGALEKLRKAGVLREEEDSEEDPEMEGGKAGANGGGSGRPWTCADVADASPEALRRALGPRAGAALRDAARGIDRRAWEARPPRKSVGAQVTWGVRFEAPAEAVAFVEKLAGEVATRASAVGAKGRTVTLKLLRAVADQPAGSAKGGIGHGVCDHLTRSVTLSRAANDEATIAREATRMLADLDVPALEVRGAGVTLSRLEGAANAGGGVTRGFKSAPAGPRSTYAERAARYRGWGGAGEERGGDERDAAKEKMTSPGAGKHAYAEAIRAREGTLEAALARGTKRPAPPDKPDPETDDAEREDEREPADAIANENESDPDAALPPTFEAVRSAYEDAARANAALSLSPTGAASAPDCALDVVGILGDAEAALASLAAGVFEAEGEAAAGRELQRARALTRAQEFLPPFVVAMVPAAGMRASALVNAWREACDRVEEDVVRVALTQ